MAGLALFSLEGKTAVITGAAQGLGKAIALLFAEAGCRLMLADIDGEPLERTAEELRAAGAAVAYEVCDLRKAEDVERLRDSALGRYGRVDVLVSNAAVFQSCAAEAMDFDLEWRRVMSVNVDASFRVCQALGQVMIRQGGGSIVIMSSKSGIAVDVPQKQLAYNVSKAALIMMAKTLAVEWAPYGIRVNCIAPGNIITEKQKPNYDANTPIVRQWMTMNAMHRGGLPHEVASAALYLACDASSYVTGAVEVVDGGYLAM